MKKKKFYFNKSYDYFFIVERGRFINDLCNLYGSLCLNKLFNFEPILIKDNYSQNDIVFQHFIITKKKIIFNYYKIFNNLTLFFLSLKHALICIYNLYLKGFEWLINNYSINNIKLGDLIYDTYIKVDHKYTDIRVNLSILNIVFKTCYRVIKLQKLFKLYKPKLILVGTDGYAYNSAIMMRIALKNKIKVYEIQPTRIIEVKKYKEKFGADHIRLIYKENNYSFDKKNIINHYNHKKKNKHKIIPYVSTDTLFLANKNKYKNKKKIFCDLKLNISDQKKYDKIILIASHAFSDAPHVTGYQIFRDYYDHMYKTLYFINNTHFEKNILWIFKEHPASFLYGEKKIFKNLVDQFCSEKIVYCSNNINTYDLIKMCDHVITTRGTIGLEFAAEGKRPILAGASSYSHLGFSIDPKNKEEYFKVLKNIHKIKNLDEKQIFKAKEVIYFLDNNFHYFKLASSNIISLSRMKKKYYLDMLKNKVSNSEKISIKDTLRNLSNKKLIEDPFYKSLSYYFKNNVKF